MKSNYSLFLIATTSLTVILSLFGSPASAQLSEKPQANLSVETKKPNVLFISIDDLNDWIGVLGGHAQAKTPNLDRLPHVEPCSSTHIVNHRCAIHHVHQS